jgi:hypothetical protein
MIAIYSNNYSTDHYIQQLKFQQQYQVYHSIDQYVEVTADYKIAFVNHLNSYEPAQSEQQRLQHVINGYKFFQEIDQLKNTSDLVFAFDNELHQYHLSAFLQRQEKNIFWVIPGQINDNTIANSTNVIVWNAHFDALTYSYQELIHKTQPIQHNTVKPFYFDALLGQARLHREFLFNTIQNSALQEKFIVTYMNSATKNFKTDFHWEPDIEQFSNTITQPTDHVIYHGQEIALCRILPIQVYNNAAYSIVAETGNNNQYSFFTEKTAKPMMARRLFVMFSGYRFLQNLHKLGFKTFNNVIDERYDLIHNDHDRWTAAFEQIKKLCNMDQSEVFAKIAPTVEHNYNLLMNTDWTQHMLNQLQQKLDNLI